MKSATRALIGCTLVAACARTMPSPHTAVCLSPTPADVRFETATITPPAMQKDVPVVTVRSESRLASSVRATLRVDVLAPATVGGQPVDNTYLGFNPEYPNRLTIESDDATVDDPVLTAKTAGADPRAQWSAGKLSFEVRFTPSSISKRKPRLRFKGHLVFGLCTNTRCTTESVGLVWSVSREGTETANGARIGITHDFRSHPQDPHRHVWAALIPVAAYPADDTCLILDLAHVTLGQQNTFSTRNRDDIAPYAACTSPSRIELRAPPGDYYLLVSAAGAGWWTNGNVRRKLTVGERDLVIQVTDRDLNETTCGD